MAMVISMRSSGKETAVTNFFENTGSSHGSGVFVCECEPVRAHRCGHRLQQSEFCGLGWRWRSRCVHRQGQRRHVRFFENTGTSSSAPAFSAARDESVRAHGCGGFYSSPSFADVDGDGDLDAFIGERYGATYFFENIDPVAPLELTVSLWLEGPVAFASMITALSADLPETDPYFGTASVAANFFTSDPTGQQVVDWIWLELRTGDPTTPPMTTVASTAALLLADGSVVASDGTSVPPSRSLRAATTWSLGTVTMSR